MILLDTNVVSELMRRAPERAVLDWFAGQGAERLHLSTVSEAELRTGVAILPAGRRRNALQEALDATVDQDFAGRILPFDSAAARAYAEIAASRRAAGRPITEADCQIAAIARSRGGAVATRNVQDFAETGVEVVDPWG